MEIEIVVVVVVIKADLVSVVPVEAGRTGLSCPLGVDTEEILTTGGVGLVFALTTSFLNKKWI